MFEAHGLDFQGHIPVMNQPTFGQGVVIPLTAPRRRAIINGIGFVPEGMAFGVVPNHLGVGANQDILAPFFQPLSVRGVQQ